MNRLRAQETSAVTETQPMITGGLEIGYQIKSKEVRKVDDKGDFNRYAVKFYVTNKRSEAKIIFFKEEEGNTVSDELAQFHCLNATGALYTSKAATILADPCVVTGLVDIKDCGSDKTAQVKKSAQIGYWIKPGQTISTDEILIVPVNEAPKIQAYYMVGAKQPDNTSSSASDNSGGGLSSSINLQDFLKVKNAGNSTYLNIQTGPPTSTAIQKGWFSAQWLFVPVPGTSYYNIKNKWHYNFLDVDKNNLVLSLNGQGISSIWALEPTHDANVFKIKNIQAGSYLMLDGKKHGVVCKHKRFKFILGIRRAVIIYRAAMALLYFPAILLPA